MEFLRNHPREVAALTAIVTMRIYAHANLDDMRTAVGKLGDQLR